MEAVAKLRNCPMSARKMRLVVDNIRGKRIDHSLDLLRYTNKEAAKWLEKLLLSAIANWEYKTDMSLSADDFDLVIKTAFVDQGRMLKRFQPAPQGRAHRIRKHSNHVTIIVENRIATDYDTVEAAVEETEAE